MSWSFQLPWGLWGWSGESFWPFCFPSLFPSLLSFFYFPPLLFSFKFSSWLYHSLSGWTRKGIIPFYSLISLCCLYYSCFNTKRKHSNVVILFHWHRFSVLKSNLMLWMASLFARKSLIYSWMATPLAETVKCSKHTWNSFGIWRFWLSWHLN